MEGLDREMLEEVIVQTVVSILNGDYELEADLNTGIARIVKKGSEPENKRFRVTRVNIAAMIGECAVKHIRETRFR